MYAEIPDFFKIMNYISGMSQDNTSLHALFPLFKISNDSLIFKVQ